jgi:hypothetical protein
MTRTTVLAVGIEPAFADLSQFPNLTPELVRHFIETQIQQLRALGYDVESCLIDLGDAAEATLKPALRAKRFDCVVIGVGLRKPPEMLLLFEKVINIVHALAPEAKIAFNTNPADTANAVRRWVDP